MNRKSSSARFVCQLAVVAVCSMTILAGHAALSSETQKLTSANTGFAFKLLKEIAKEQPGKNIFISPYSVSTVLQMVENGAGGKTKEELRQALGIAGLSQAAQNEANRDLSRSPPITQSPWWIKSSKKTKMAGWA